MNNFYYLIDTLNKYRLNYFIVHFTIGLLLLNYYQALTVTTVFIALCISCLFLSSHIFNKIYDRLEDSIVSPFETNFSDKVFYFATMLLVILPTLGLIYLNKPLLPFICLVPYTFFYSYPIYKNLRIKNILFLKNITPATFWSASYLVLLFYTFGFLPTDWHISAGIIWFLVFALNVIFDIRDVAGDKAANVHTIPNTFGVFTAKTIILILLLGVLLYLIIQGTSVMTMMLVLLFCVATVMLEADTSARWYHGIMYAAAFINLLHLI